jgi:hypothetical protein
MRRVEHGEASETDKLLLEKTRLLEAIETLKAKKDRMTEQAYTAELQRLFVQLAKINNQIKAETPASR